MSALVDAKALAATLSVDRDWVYAHADELGALRLGTGPRARLRFDPEKALERLTSLASKGSPGPDAASQRASQRAHPSRPASVPVRVPAIRLVARGRTTRRAA